MRPRHLRFALPCAFLLAACATEAPERATGVWSEEERRAAPPALEGEIVYRVMTDRFANGDPGNDRGDIAGGRLDHGFDPTRTRFYHGGDLKGVQDKLPYIQNLGATAIQLSPLMAGIAVRGAPGQETANWHGEWLSDLTRLDPHLGTMDDLRALTDAAHARGIKVYADVVLNGTADLFSYEECASATPCRYRGEASFPYTTRGDALSDEINTGFAGENALGRPNYAALVDPRWAYTPLAPKEDVRAPDWLRDPVHYHQRGDAGEGGEARRNGDMPDQDDLFTEHPTVASGLIAAYGELAEAGGIDGFRVRDARALTPAFLRTFTEAMERRAALDGRTFAVWGQADITDPAALARTTHEGGLALVEDTAFTDAVRAAIAGNAPTTRLSEVFVADPIYDGGELTARRLPIAIESLEHGRFARAVRPSGSDVVTDEAERLARTRLAAVLLMTARGTPVLYMGGEQGFGASGQASAQDMMATRVGAYAREDLLGTDASPADENFDTQHPYYRFIADLARLRKDERAFSRGSHVTRYGEAGPGLYAFSRILGIGDVGEEILVVLNTADKRRDAFVEVDPRSATFERLSGYCASGTAARASYPVSVPPMGFVICKSSWGGERE